MAVGILLLINSNSDLGYFTAHCFNKKLYECKFSLKDFGSLNTKQKYRLNFVHPKCVTNSSIAKSHVFVA